MSKEAIQYINATLAAFGPNEAISMTKETWAKLHEAMKALAEQPAQQDSACSNTLRAQGKAYPRTCKKCGLGPCVGLAQQALDKMAENARELGLDYEPAQQEPAGSVYRYGKDSSGKQWHGIRWTASGLDLPDGTLIYTSPPAQQEPVAWICEGSSSDEKHAIDYWPEDVDDLPIGTQLYTSPPAQRTWVGLTDEERKLVRNSVGYNQFMTAGEYSELVQKATEAKLKEKNNV